MEDQKTTGVLDVNETSVAPITYPTSPDDEGFFIDNAEDAEMQIYTKVYENDNIIKKCFLPRCKKTAIVRETTGKDTKETYRYMGNNKEKYLTSGLTVATTIDGKKETFEFYELLKSKDYNRLIAMFQDLNF